MVNTNSTNIITNTINECGVVCTIEHQPTIQICEQEIGVQFEP